jgi:hypothetical protein
LQFEYEDGRRDHQLQVIVQNADGKQYANATAKIGIGEIPPGVRVTANQILNFQQIKMVRPDEISFRLLWDGQEIQRVQLTVQQLPEQPPQLQQPPDA